MKTSPTVYKPDKQGYNGMDGKDVPAGQEEAARRGAEVCPERAIQLTDD
jgi:ferredoxin